MQVYELIERAIAHAGTARAVAERLGAQPQEVSDWRHGRRTCPPDMRARLAQMAGEDPIEAALTGLAEGLNEARREGFRAAVGRAMAKFYKAHRMWRPSIKPALS